MITSTDGIVTTANAFPIWDVPGICRRINLYNPNATAAPFILRKVRENPGGLQIIRQWDDSIPATDSWERGSLGGVMVLQPGSRLELIMDAAPVKPIEFTVDYSTEL